jgi:pimeloyl-ACP methyl ester carboxylesterase
MCPISPRNPAPYDDPKAVEQKEQSRLNPEEAAALRAKMASGEHIREPEAFYREVQRVITPMSMGRPEAPARMKSDSSTLPNEWWHNQREHNELHAPLESRTNYNWLDGIARILVPTLVLHGQEDLIPLASSEEWARTLPDARLFVFAHSGHYPHLEKPECFFPVVSQFLTGGWPVGAIKIE